MRRRKRVRALRISAVAQRFDIHPQTLRLYEREGLIHPPRSSGNTRLYDDATLARLEAILTLTRDMGVNLAGVEVILRLREQIEEMRMEMERLHRFARRQGSDRRAGVRRQHALVKIERGPLTKN